jgi:PTS system fructose-specific IIA component
VRLRDLLGPGRIQVGLAARERKAAIAELVGLLVADGAIAPADRARVERAVLEREASRPTGMENGVALPHGAVEGVEDFAAALGIAREGIDFQAPDGRPARLVILLVVPPNMLQFHVRTLAGIARVLNDERLREALAAARSAEEALAAIEAGEEGSP